MPEDDIVRRAAALAPELAKRAFETVAERRMLADNVEQLREAGLFRLLQPRMWGGLESNLHLHLDVVEEISAACGSTGWCLGVMHAHSWYLSLFEESAQRDVYGENPDARISAVLTPRGKARRVDDGYVLNGFWPFCSGCHHSQWLLLGAQVVDEAGAPLDEVVLLVPTAQASIQDDWYVGGLAGTGSNSLKLKDVQVPAHRSLSTPLTREGKAPGTSLHASNLYHCAPVPALALFLCAPALGIARRALDSFRRRLPGRIVAYTFDEKQLEMPVTHVELAEAATRIDAARVLLHAVAGEIESWAQKHEMMPIERRAKMRMDCAFAVRLCLEATETLYLASGGAGLAASSEVQLAARDLHAINLHGKLALKTNLEMYGRMLVGLPVNSPVL